MKNKAVFIDRDGTINIDVPYLDNPEKFELYPGVGEGVKKLKDNGFKIIVITNQSGIARGYFTEEVLFKIHEKMKIEFNKFDVKLNGIYYCPHHAEDNCNCRKPKTELFENAIKEHDINVKQSYMIGDKMLDVFSGYRIGARTILLLNTQTKKEYLSTKNKYCCVPNYIAYNFLDAVEWGIKNQSCNVF